MSAYRCKTLIWIMGKCSGLWTPLQPEKRLFIRPGIDSFRVRNTSGQTLARMNEPKAEKRTNKQERTALGRTKQTRATKRDGLFTPPPSRRPRAHNPRHNPLCPSARSSAVSTHSSYSSSYTCSRCFFRQKYCIFFAMSGVTRLIAVPCGRNGLPLLLGL